jgi:hypothetical protein
VESGCYVAVVHEAHSTSSCGAGIDKFVRGTDETETSKSILKTDMDGASSPAFQYKRKTLSQNEKRNCRVMKRGKKKKKVSRRRLPRRNKHKPHPHKEVTSPALAQHLTYPQTPRCRCKRKVPTTHPHVRNKSSPHTVACAGTHANSAIQRPLISQHQISRYYQQST